MNINQLAAGAELKVLIIGGGGAAASAAVGGDLVSGTLLAVDDNNLEIQTLVGGQNKVATFARTSVIILADGQ